MPILSWSPLAVVVPSSQSNLVDEGGGAVVAGRTAHLHEQVVGSPSAAENGVKEASLES